MVFGSCFVRRTATFFGAGELVDCPIFCVGELCCAAEPTNREAERAVPTVIIPLAR